MNSNDEIPFMRTLRTLAATTLSLSAIMLLSVAALARPVSPVSAHPPRAMRALDITGKWLFSVVLDAGSGTPTVTFKQEGEKLTGHYSSQTLGELDFTGTLKEKALSFKLKGDMGGQSLEVTYSGTVTDSVNMKGSVDFGGMASGTFTGKKQ